MNPIQWLQDNSDLMGILGINTIFAYSVFLPLSIGQFQVAQPVFTAIGGYTAGWFALHSHLPIIVTMAFGVALACVVAIIMTPLLLRLSGLFLGLASFALVGLTSAIALNLSFLGGAVGLYNIPRRVTSLTIWIVAVIVIALVVKLRRSSFGLAMRMMRDDPVAAPGTGLSTFRINVVVFAFSAGIAAIAEVLAVNRFHHIGPEQFTLTVILSALTYVIVGGLGNASGPVIGALLIGLLTNKVNLLQHWQILVNGAFLLFVVIFFPGGLSGIRIPRSWWTLGRDRRPPATTVTDAVATPANAGPAL